MRKFYLIRKQVFLLLSFLAPFYVMSQTAGISGNVSDDNGQPLPGTTVLIEGTANGTMTDPDGNYTLDGLSGGTYVITWSFIGYGKQTDTIALSEGQKVQKNVALSEDALLLDAAVVVGYGTKKVKDLTGSVTTITSDNFSKGSITTPEQLVTGKIAGVQITSNNGMPGSGSRIRIRGGTSINASNDPLIVIDGVPVDNTGISGSANALNMINPNDIETITILKDASAAAIYGSRAANGVIIITTKKADIGDNTLHIGFSTNNGISTVTNYVDVLSADEYRDLINANGTAGQKALLGDASTDWQKEIYRIGFSTDNNISLTGGLKQLPYRLDLEYLLDNGILKRSQLSRTGLSLNLSPVLWNGHIRIDANGKFYHSDNVFADQGAIGSAITFDPTKPVFEEGSPYGGYYEWEKDGVLLGLAPKNPVGLIEEKDDLSNVNRAIGNLKIDYKFHFLPDLHGILNLGTDISHSDGTVTIPAEAASSFDQGGANNQYNQSKSNKLLEAYFNYVKKIRAISSQFDITAGYSYQNWLTKSDAFPSLSFDGDTITPAGIPFETENTLISFYGRLNYSLKDRYLLTATLRDDGSSRFSPDNRWGLFPSVAFAWVVSDEPFMKGSVILTYLKLRLGYGITGQQDIFNDYPYIPNYDQSTSTAQYQFGDVFYTVLRPDGYDANIKWEETASSNVGIDFGFGKNKVNGSIDVYQKKTSDLLAVVPIPAGTNFTNQILTNVGNMENKGLEVNLNISVYNHANSSLDLGVNGTMNKNEITNLTKVQDSTSIGILVGGISGGIGNTIQIQTVGYPANTFYAYQQVYGSDGKPVEGEYVDVNGDSIINTDDRTWGENPSPEFYMGFYGNFRYQKWFASFSLRGEFGNYVYNNVSSIRGNFQNVSGAGNYLQNLTSDYLETEFQHYGTPETFLSDYYIENASYVRMDNVSVGYNFGRIMNKKVSLQAAFIVQNVFVLTHYSGLDPEIPGGIDNSIYPRPRIYSVNLNLQL